MAFEQEIKVYRFLAGYGEGLLEGLDADKASTLICDGGVNPAWIVGHLGCASNMVGSMMGGASRVDLDVWKPLFGGGSQPSTDTSAYPSWDELLSEFRAGHEGLVAAVSGVGDEQLAGPNPNDRMRETLPTVQDFLSFVLTGHVAMHLGQLSTWRRVQGQPPLF